MSNGFTKGRKGTARPTDKKDVSTRKKAALTAVEKDRLTHYQKLLKLAEDMQQMTETRAWRRLYTYMMDQVASHAEAILDAEKVREVIHHQEAVKVLRDLLRTVRAPIKSVNDYVKECPLFVGANRVTVKWDAKAGTVRFVKLLNPPKDKK